MKPLTLLTLIWYPTIWIVVFASRIGDIDPARPEERVSWEHVGCVFLVVAPCAMFGFLAGVMQTEKDKKE